MKKLFLSFMFVVFACGVMNAKELFRAGLVYDYSASIKRIDPTYSVEKYDETETVAFKYNVVSDSLKGVVRIAECACCSASGVSQMVEGTGEIFIYRQGDTWGTFEGHKKAIYSRMRFGSGLFGAKVAQNVYLRSGAPLDPINNNQAWFVFNLNVERYDEPCLPVGKLLKQFEGVTDDEGNLIKVYYGFFGVNNISRFSLVHQGFGQAETTITETPTTTGWCTNVPGNVSTCSIIKRIDGSVTGMTWYAGSCNVQAMWDVCYSTSGIVVNRAPICGTWNMVLNETISKIEDTTAQNKAILEHLNLTAADVDIVTNID